MLKFYLLLLSTVISLNLPASPIASQETPYFLTTESSTAFLRPSERYLISHPLAKIKPHYKVYGVTPEHVKVFDTAIAAEKDGFFGYHGARKEFRIYQDIIRFGIEEILGIPIKPDFHFLRIPGDPNQNVHSAAEFLAMYSDTPIDVFPFFPLEAQRLLSMNMTLYGNYWHYDQSSVYFFVTDTSFGDINYKHKLITFFTKLGVDPSYIEEAFNIGLSTLSDGGILMQFFDTSNYALVDEQAYLSYEGGKKYYTNEPISTLILDPHRTDFPQFRLLLSNRHILNPKSAVEIKRYEMTSPAALKSYEQAMRDYFQTCPVDVYQKEIYRSELLTTWDAILI